MREFTNEQIIEMYENEELELIEDGDWIQNGKYQFFDVIVYNKENDTHYKLEFNRVGSYHSDYDYGDTSVHIVYPVTETITKTVWKYKK